MSYEPTNYTYDAPTSYKDGNNRRSDQGDFARDRVGGGDYDNNAGSTGFGPTETRGGTFGDSQRQIHDTSGPGNFASDTSEAGYGGHTTQNFDGGPTENAMYGASGAGAGTGRTAGDFGSTGLQTRDRDPTKPSFGDKMRGTAETMAGKATRNPELVERGQERKTGEFRQTDF